MSPSSANTLFSEATKGLDHNGLIKGVNHKKVGRDTGLWQKLKWIEGLN